MFKLTPIKSNMTTIETTKYRILFSYSTPVAFVKDGIYYTTKTKWSRTTTKHINQWIGNSVLPLHIHSIDQYVLDNLL